MFPDFTDGPKQGSEPVENSTHHLGLRALSHWCCEPCVKKHTQVFHFCLERGSSSVVMSILLPVCVRDMSGLPTVIHSENRWNERVTVAASAATGWHGPRGVGASSESEQWSRCVDPTITACTKSLVLAPSCFSDLLYSSQNLGDLYQCMSHSG